MEKENNLKPNSNYFEEELKFDERWNTAQLIKNSNCYFVADDCTDRENCIE